MVHNACRSRVTSIAAQAVVVIVSALGSAAAHAVDEPTLSATVIDGSRAYMQITRVQFLGDAGPYEARLEELASDLTLRVPLRTADLQTALQAMRELPGLTVRASTRRDESRPSSYALTIATEYKPFDASIQFSNRGTREIGPMFAISQVVGNSLLGWHERLGLFASAATDPDEYRGGGVFFDVPVTEAGTHLTTTAFKTQSNPTERLDRDDHYDRERVSLRTAGTLDSQTPATLSWSAGVDWDNLDITRDDMRLRTEKLRVLEVGGRISGRTGTSSEYLLGLQVRRGLNGFGSTLDALDLAEDPRRKDFLLTKLQLTELVRFAQSWSVRLDAFGQQSAYVLPDAERYKIGGERLGRGFEITELAGDQGLGAKAELRRELSSAAAVIGKTSLYGFYDFAAAWKQDLPGRESAATAGIGLAVEYWRLSGFIEVAKPLTNTDVEGDRDAKVFAEVKLKL